MFVLRPTHNLYIVIFERLFIDPVNTLTPIGVFVTRMHKLRRIWWLCKLAKILREKWQSQWEEKTSNKLHGIKPKLGPPAKTFLSRRDECGLTE
jgi:hypothetical protein